MCIAGLFELADEEFVGLRTERQALRLKARRDLERGDESAPLTVATLSEFLETWRGVEKLQAAAEKAGFETKDDEFEAGQFTSDIYDTAVLAGISDLEGLRKALEKADVGYLVVREQRLGR